MSNNQQISVFADKETFDHNLRVCKMLSQSELVPKQFQETGNNKGISNTMIAVNIAKRVGADPLMIMQNLTIIHGKPSWSSQYIIASINSTNRFGTLKYRHKGEGMEASCVAYAVDKETGETVESPEVNMAMAKAEGWLDKNGSKWKTMPKLMLMYRAASFFGRLYCPEILMGLQSTEEIIDVHEVKAPVYNDAQVSGLLAVVAENPTEETLSELEAKMQADGIALDQLNDILIRANEIVSKAKEQPVSVEPPLGGQSDESKNESGTLFDQQ